MNSTINLEVLYRDMKFKWINVLQIQIIYHIIKKKQQKKNWGFENSFRRIPNIVFEIYGANAICKHVFNSILLLRNYKKISYYYWVRQMKRKFWYIFKETVMAFSNIFTAFHSSDEEQVGTVTEHKPWRNILYINQFLTFFDLYWFSDLIVLTPVI